MDLETWGVGEVGGLDTMGMTAGELRGEDLGDVPALWMGDLTSPDVALMRGDFWMEGVKSGVDRGGRDARGSVCFDVEPVTDVFGLFPGLGLGLPLPFKSCAEMDLTMGFEAIWQL